MTFKSVKFTGNRAQQNCSGKNLEIIDRNREYNIRSTSETFNDGNRFLIKKRKKQKINSQLIPSDQIGRVKFLEEKRSKCDNNRRMISGNQIGEEGTAYENPFLVWLVPVFVPQLFLGKRVNKSSVRILSCYGDNKNAPMNADPANVYISVIELPSERVLCLEIDLKGMHAYNISYRKIRLLFKKSIIRKVRISIIKKNCEDLGTVQFIIELKNRTPVIEGYRKGDGNFPWKPTIVEGDSCIPEKNMGHNHRQKRKSIGIEKSNCYCIRLRGDIKENITKIKKMLDILGRLEEEDEDDDLEEFEDGDNCINIKDNSSLELVKKTKISNYDKNYSSISEFLSKQDYLFQYMIECSISQGLLVRRNLTANFFILIESLGIHEKRAFLRKLLMKKKTIYEPYKYLLEFVGGEHSKVERRKLQNELELNMLEEGVVLSLTITDSRIKLHSPRIDCGNRVLRTFPKHRDHFIRVKFCEEDTGRFPKRNKEFQRRVRQIMINGLEICGRKFLYLATGESQLRSGSCWFMCPIEKYGKRNRTISPQQLIRQFGNFQELESTAKRMSRIGLCFSATYDKPKTLEKYEWITIPDIERNDYVFTDGVGMVDSKFLKKVLDPLPISRSKKKDICCIQVRIGGCKGLLVSHANLHMFKIAVRNSMQKYLTDSTITLDVCHGKYSHFISLFLNRELIMGLEARDLIHQISKTEKIPSHVKEKIQNLENVNLIYKYLSKKEIVELKNEGRIHQNLMNKFRRNAKQIINMNSSEEECIRNLQTIFFDRQISRLIFQAYHSGFSILEEPYLKRLIFSLSRSRMKLLEGKANLYIEDGAQLLGICDNFQVLQPGEVFVRIKKESEKKRVFEEKVIVGRVFICKNPAIHPGDTRTFNAVNPLKSRTLTNHEKNWFKMINNVVVFSVLGDRPNCHEMSGSDLDGDQYNVLWDSSILPTNENFEPFDYDRIVNSENSNGFQNLESLQPKGENESERMVDYFLKYQQFYNLGPIAFCIYSHYAIQPMGILDDSCVSLAGLYSLSVDSPKTGMKVMIPYEFSKLRKRPKYLWRKNPNISESSYFDSLNLVGELFRIAKAEMRNFRAKKFLGIVKRRNNKDELIQDFPYDSEIVNKNKLVKIKNFDKVYKEAVILKEIYDEEILKIMKENQIRTEFDIMTQGYHFYLDKFSAGVRSIQLGLQKIKNAFTRFFKSRAKTIEDKYFIASVWYYVAYCSPARDLRRISFPWIISDILFKLKKLKFGKLENPFCND